MMRTLLLAALLGLAAMPARADLFVDGHLTGREGVVRLPSVPGDYRPSPTIDRTAEPRRSW